MRSWEGRPSKSRTKVTRVQEKVSAAVVPRNSETNGKRCKNGDESLRKSLSLDTVFVVSSSYPTFPDAIQRKR